ncbi:MAG: hypothetical protein JJ992_01705, partial [Planctomycetes bacterium]|nr:hypothetical protein [Planctomycetota bacterium]
MNTSCRVLYFLHATAHSAAQGEKVGQYVLEYEDGQRERAWLVYDGNTANWWVQSGAETSPELPHAEVAWRGQNAYVARERPGTSLVLYAASWS